MTGCPVLDNVVGVARKNGKRLPCERLQAENEKLREEVELVGTAGYLLATKQLKAENQTLRQLAESLADCRNTSCDDCVRWDYQQGGCTLDEVLRECGIEVPE